MVFLIVWFGSTRLIISARCVHTMVDVSVGVRYGFEVIFCFDFDLTLTDFHSGGFPDIEQEYFEPSSLVEVQTTFAQLKEGNHTIYIVTRSMESLVQQYISQPRIGLSDYVSKTFGADNQFPVHKEGDDSRGLLWAHKKADFLNTIVDSENGKKEDVHFFDDTKINIDVAVESGFVNSYNNTHIEHGAALMPVVRNTLERCYKGT